MSTRDLNYLPWRTLKRPIILRSLANEVISNFRFLPKAKFFICFYNEKTSGLLQWHCSWNSLIRGKLIEFKKIIWVACLIFVNFIYLNDIKLIIYNLAVETQHMQYDVGMILSQILQRLGYISLNLGLPMKIKLENVNSVELQL